MGSQFDIDRSVCSTQQESYEGLEELNPNRRGAPWQFVIEVQQLLGGDFEPDPLFFAESWSLSVPVAVENFHRRQRENADCERNGNGFKAIKSASFVQEREAYAELHSSARAESISEGHYAGSPPHSPEWSAAGAQDPAQQERRTFAEDCDSSQETTRPMTRSRACELLGVTATSTRGQIKAAYRQLAIQWHPDRLECTTQEMRQFATEKMVEINAAYRLLRSGRLQGFFFAWPG